MIFWRETIITTGIQYYAVYEGVASNPIHNNKEVGPKACAGLMTTTTTTVRAVDGRRESTGWKPFKNVSRTVV